MSSQSRERELRGRVLEVKSQLSGHSTVKLDNGPVKTITLVCHTETLGDLLGADTKVLWEHLMTRKPGHFRVKRGSSSS